MRKYYEVLSNKKMIDAKVQTIVNLYASAYAFGTITKENFNKFIETLDPKTKKSLDDFAGKLKEMGLPIEEK